MSKIILITGDLESGKTNLCLELSQKAREAGLQVGGVISPAVFEGDRKTAIEVLDLKSGDRKRLAELGSLRQTSLETKRWSFFPEVVEWGNQMLEESVPCDLLIVDELGPLEFTRNEGWINGFSVLDSGEYQLAFVVIRPSLVEAASERWNTAKIINLDDADTDLAKDRDVQKLIDLVDFT